MKKIHEIIITDPHQATNADLENNENKNLAKMHNSQFLDIFLRGLIGSLFDFKIGNHVKESVVHANTAVYSRSFRAVLEQPTELIDWIEILIRRICMASSICTRFDIILSLGHMYNRL